MMTRITVTPSITAELDPGFCPAVLWNREYRKLVRELGGRPLLIALERPNGTRSVRRTELLPDRPEFFPLTWKFVERQLKFLLWMKGGFRITLAGADDRLLSELRHCYSPEGERCSDAEIMGPLIYGHEFELRGEPASELPEVELQLRLGGHDDGGRIGFDLGGSDRKCAAVLDGRVVHTEEVPWDPYFQSDPQYHLAGIRDSIARAAAHLPRVDAIGGSAAGIYVDGVPRLASLFRGLSPADFHRVVVPFFRQLEAEYGVPVAVANDGEVTALAGARALNSAAVLGISLGTSEAAGYVSESGTLTDWLNELAFAPVDYRDDAPRDEWSGDRGCGVQYFSQQAVARLAPAAGLTFPDDLPLPRRLEEVQKLMAAADPRAAAIYRTLGVYLGYGVAHYADFYPLRKLLALGRVTSGPGGELLVEVARQVLAREFPELELTLHLPDEEFKRHGQAVVAAGLPELRRSSC